MKTAMKREAPLPRTVCPKTSFRQCAISRAARLLPGLLLALFSVQVQAQISYWSYWTNNGTITIWGYGGPRGAVTIPDTINGLPVTTLEGGLFAGWTSLTSVTIPDSVTVIGEMAFGSCINLKSIRLPNGLTAIAREMFSWCTSLTTITIPTNVTSLGIDAFGFCTSLTNVTMGNRVATIEEWAFRRCPKLNSISLPGSVTSIGVRAFESCGVTSITIPDSVITIGTRAFSDCTNLAAITVDVLNPNYSSAGGVLFDKSQTALIQCPGGKAGRYRVPDGVITIKDHAFSGCSGLTCIVFPSSVTSVQEDAFLNCTGLKGAYFLGNAPIVLSSSFGYESQAVVYYLPGTTGWGPTLGDPPLLTALWLPQVTTTGADFGVRTNGFGFNISWADGMTVVVEASTSLANPAWLPISTNAITDGGSHFSDAEWTNHPARFYRVRRW